MIRLKRVSASPAAGRLPDFGEQALAEHISQVAEGMAGSTKAMLELAARTPHRFNPIGVRTCTRE